MNKNCSLAPDHYYYRLLNANYFFCFLFIFFKVCVFIVFVRFSIEIKINTKKQGWYGVRNSKTWIFFYILSLYYLSHRRSGDIKFFFCTIITSQIERYVVVVVVRFKIWQFLSSCHNKYVAILIKNHNSKFGWNIDI